MPARLPAVTTRTAMPALACFDLDGTLIEGDSFALYLTFLIRRGYVHPAWTGLMGATWLARRSRLVTLPSAKQRMLRPLKGLHQEQIARWGDEFAADVLSRRVRGSMRDRLHWHRSRGDAIVIVTSAPDAYIGAVSRLFSIQDAYATPLLFEDAVFTGRLGPHLFGREKAARLAALTPEAGTEAFAYSDHHSDLPLLRASTYPHAVNPTRTLRHEAVRRNWAIVER